ncbi:uncharacterized protein BYT42DRAFT_546544 [Radiomyces spectabilis]|uniref:uncharacterized protein n=1 Tax=Radiomyces spectabilis TaxID=64574 RepID=UPI00221FF52A|nr:uncharacterized protein BYT42DRAFT_546544 [Radiomyces spectabilis]KAI8377929.1 hypothetical protein BYT42DRAFT_546544 [Radiomyces spectabilis]
MPEMYLVYEVRVQYQCAKLQWQQNTESTTTKADASACVRIGKNYHSASSYQKKRRQEDVSSDRQRIEYLEGTVRSLQRELHKVKHEQANCKQAAPVGGEDNELKTIINSHYQFLVTEEQLSWNLDRCLTKKTSSRTTASLQTGCHRHFVPPVSPEPLGISYRLCKATVLHPTWRSENVSVSGSWNLKQVDLLISTQFIWTGKTVDELAAAKDLQASARISGDCGDISKKAGFCKAVDWIHCPDTGA